MTKLLLSCLALYSSTRYSYAFSRPQQAVTILRLKPLRDSSPSVDAPEDSQLAQLSRVTTLSIDSGDLDVIRSYAATGYITDATTNPLFVSQAGLSGDPTYQKMLRDAVEYTVNQSSDSKDSAEVVSLAIDRLAVNLGKAISEIVPGYISTEVDPRLSFDTEASVQRGRRIIAMYEELGVGRERVLIKLAATWDGIQAAAQLEAEGIRCNLTLVFSVVQAMACAQNGAHLISPFPGRILDWHNADKGRTGGVEPDVDEGVVACRQMFAYFKKMQFPTICMPASWRPSRGKGYELDEVLALAGSDRMTIPAPLLGLLAADTSPIQIALDANNIDEIDLPDASISNNMTEKEFRLLLNMDACGTTKLAEGIRVFIGETEKLEAVIRLLIAENVQA